LYVDPPTRHEHDGNKPTMTEHDGNKPTINPLRGVSYSIPAVTDHLETTVVPNDKTNGCGDANYVPLALTLPHPP